MSDAPAKSVKTMPAEQNKNVDPKALATPFVLVVTLFTAVLIAARWGLAAEITVWVLFVIGLQIWGEQQRRKARREVRTEIERSGCKVIEMKSRFFKLGPFSVWNNSRTQCVYRAVVRESTGRERVVWARWGRQWFWNPNTLELKWDDELRG